MTYPHPISVTPQEIRYDIYCPLETIAGHLHAICRYYDQMHRKYDSLFYESRTEGKVASFKSRQRSLLSSEKVCMDHYRWTIESLGKLFRIDLNPDDYPVEKIRVHIRYSQSDITQFIYEQVKEICSGKCTEAEYMEGFSEINLEDEYTIGLTCRTLKDTTNLWKIFFGPESLYYKRLEGDEYVEKYNNDDRLENSTHTMITSICLIMMLLGLITQCSA